MFKILDTFICDGITTIEIDTKVENYIVNVLSAQPASKGQYDYQYFSVNSSVNDVVFLAEVAQTHHLQF